ncbi:restriction endonuclease subunit S [Citrobacter sp. EC_71]|uniref:restriction endonuclease subunit S n=1 Tax=Citrobacter sp. EC_71 TaxID=2584093 RepID=UPI001C707C1B|nr:restriction endonuclease subunit S [Citrobacter sp. EC_71]MBW9354511.1 restriction endonuclease subunit S [Citrobacter sp. EC_71]
MAKYKTYPEYKDSGVEWLGEIPAHWDIHSMKRSVKGCTNGIWGGEPDGKDDIIVLRVADFDRQHFLISDLKLTTRSIPLKDRETRLLKKGDLLIEKSGGGDKTLVGCVVLFDKEYDAITSNFVAKMTPRRGYNNQFLKYAFSQLYAGNVNYPSIKQTTGIQNIDSGSYLMERFCFPSNKDQYQIAVFLDRETAKIDNLIEKQQQLIELLKEKRQAVISHAVTKGLNPDVPMKDSGVEWLGKIPQDWVICAIKNIVSIPITDGPHETPVFLDEGIPFISAEAISSGKIDFSKQRAFISHKDNIRFSKKYSPLINDIYMVKSGATTGVTAIVETDTEFNIWSPLAVIRCNASTHPYFTLNFLRSKNFQTAIELNWSFGTQQNIGMGVIGNMHITRPPLEEAIKIASYLHLKCIKFEELISAATTQISLMQERRTALISAAVTGKIDVRHWRAPNEQTTAEAEAAQ